MLHADHAAFTDDRHHHLVSPLPVLLRRCPSVFDEGHGLIIGEYYFPLDVTRA